MMSYSINDVRNMTDEQIMTEMIKIAQMVGANPVAQQDATKMYIVMAQRNGIDPRPKLMAQGMLDIAENQGWL